MDMDDFDELREYERELEELDKKRGKLVDDIKYLRKKITFDSTVEGDSCGANEGDKVIITKEDDYEGQEVKVLSKDMGSTYFTDRDGNQHSKSFTFYEVLFPDDTVITLHHTALKKAE